MDNNADMDPKLKQFLGELDGLCDRYNYIVRPELRINDQGLAYAVVSVNNRPATLDGLENNVKPLPADSTDQVVPAAPTSSPTLPQPNPTLPQPDPAPAVDVPPQS